MTDVDSPAASSSVSLTATPSTVSSPPAETTAPPSKAAQRSRLRYECEDAVLAFANLFALDHDRAAMMKLRSAYEFLRLCRYQPEDTILVMSAAVCQLRTIFTTQIPETKPDERVNIIMLQMFIAHSYLLDETCPLKVWYEHLFKSYCTFPAINTTTIKLLELQGFLLRVADFEAENTRRYLSNPRDEKVPDHLVQLRDFFCQCH